MVFVNRRSKEKLYTSYEEFLKEFQPLLDYAEKTGSAEEVRALKLYAGILNNEATKTVNIIGLGEIDYSIAGVLSWLQKHGHKTLASCSGVADDHGGKEIEKGYISFLDTPENRELIEKLCNTEENEKMFRP